MDELIGPRPRRRGGARMDRHALSPHGRRQGRGLRLRDAAGARLLRSRPRRAVRPPPLPARLASASQRGALSRLPARPRARRRRRRRPADVDPVQLRPLLLARRDRHAVRAADHRPRLRAGGAGDRGGAVAQRRARLSGSARRASPATGARSSWAGFATRSRPASRPTTPGCSCRPRSARCRSPIIWGKTKAVRQRDLVQQFPAPRRRRRRQGRPVRALVERLHLQRRPDHGSLRRADRRHRPHLARPVDLHARQSRPELLQRRDAAGDLGLSRRRPIPPRRSPIRARPSSARRTTASARTPTIGNHNFEIVGLLAGTGVNGVDADPAQAIADFLTNPQYGAGSIRPASTRRRCSAPRGDSSLQTYCRALGIAFSPALTDQEQGSSVLARWLQIVNCAAVWSGGQLKFIPYGDAAIAAGNSRRDHRADDRADADAGRRGRDAAALDRRLRRGRVRRRRRRHLRLHRRRDDLRRRERAVGRRDTTAISPAGTYLFAAGDEGQAVEIAYTYAIGDSFTPNLTPVYDLADARLRRREGQQGPGAGRARRSVLAADDPARRVPVARQRIRHHSGRGARPVADRALRRPRRVDDPGARDLRRDQCRADRRADDPAAPALCARALHVQAVMGILPARSDGHRDDHRRQSRPERLPGAHRRDRGGRQGPARRHGGGADRRRLDAGPLLRRFDDRQRPSTAASPPRRSTRR